MAKPRNDHSQYNAGGVGITSHAINRFKQRCPTHPLVGKGSATQIRRLMRDMFRRGDEVDHPKLKAREKLVKVVYRPTSTEQEHAYFLVGPSHANADDSTIVTVLNASMYASGQLLQ